MKTERVFITGCGGMLGNAIYPFFKSWYNEVLATDKLVTENWLSKLDVRNTEGLRKIFTEYKPDIVLHLAAETDLEYCETHHKITKDTNSLATKTIALLAEEFGAVLIYISTAGVFDGQKSGYYTEEDTPNPLMVYGQTKYEGELHTLKYCSKSFVIRAGWMMGGGRRKEKKFIYKILQQVGEGQKEIFAVDDKWGTPTYTYDFAMNLFLLLATKQYGRYHMVCEGKGTRHDVAKEILHICERPDIKLTRVSSDFFADEYFAPRPYSEMMCNNNLFKLGINHMRPWQEAVRDYIGNHFEDYIGQEQLEPQIKHKYSSPPNNAISTDESRREDTRTTYISTINYVNGSKDHSIEKGIGINFSNSGLCLYMFNRHSKGHKIKLIDDRNVQLEKSATIQWVTKEKNGLYKAGLLFHQ